MKRIQIKRERKTGLPPGTLYDTPEIQKLETSLHVFNYTEDQLDEGKILPDKLNDLKRRPGVVWLNVTGIWSSRLLEQIGETFTIHPLILEDIQNNDQRPKFEEHQKYVYLVTKRLYWNENMKSIDSEQISFILMDNILITFQEFEGDTFENVRNRIRERKGRIRSSKADYLFYALMDSIVDFYFSTVAGMEGALDSTENKIIQKKEETVSQDLYGLHSQLNQLRRTFYPMREVFFQLQKEAIPKLEKTTRLFIKDIQDHLLILTDFYETQKDKLTNLHAMHAMNLSERMNNIIRILTIISTIFIPLTFIVGIYGMNFRNMPELRISWAYFAVLGILGFLVIFMILIFKRKKWL